MLLDSLCGAAGRESLLKRKRKEDPDGRISRILDAVPARDYDLSGREEGEGGRREEKFILKKLL